MKIMVIGAHPDDAEYFAGGTAKKYVKAGNEVKFVSMTNGDAGHFEQRGVPLAERRKKEAWAAGQVGGLDYAVLNHHDGRLEPTLEVREELIALIRSFNPDLVMTHRPNDYHPDHRRTSVLVQDTAYLLTVPSIVPRVRHLRKLPVIVYLEDPFNKPIPFDPDVVVAIDDAINDKIAMLDCHESQFYEWLPYNQGIEDEVPLGQKERIAWLAKQVRETASKTAERFRVQLKAIYGEQIGDAVRYAEAFEACEYGSILTAENRKLLFPFV